MLQSCFIEYNLNLMFKVEMKIRIAYFLFKFSQTCFMTELTNWLDQVLLRQTFKCFKISKVLVKQLNQQNRTELLPLLFHFLRRIFYLKKKFIVS